MKTTISRNSGFAVVYGLAVLFIASISGMSIIYVSQKDRTSAGDYTKMRTAALAARAALDAFEGQCNSQPEEVIDILRLYNRKPACKWLLNDAKNANSENKFKCWNGSDAPLFSACIMKFDSANLLIQVKGIGYGGFGGKKSAIGIYKLRGMKQSSSWDQKYAIYLAGEGRNFDKKIEVNGSVYFGGDIHINGGAEGSVINGDFKTGNSNEESEFDVPFAINGNCYIQTPLKVNGGHGFSVYGKTGFEKKLTIDPDLCLYGDAYVNGNVIKKGRLDMHFNKLTYSGLYTPIEHKFYRASPSPINNHGSIDIATLLDMKTGKESHLIGSIDKIDSDKIFKFSSLSGFSNFTAVKLQSKYNEAASKGQLWDDFLVIRVEKGIKADMGSNTGTFTGKVIWIVDGEIGCNSNWYDCGPSSNTLVYVRSGGFVSDLGSGKNFRGYVHVEGTGSVRYSWRKGNSFKGAVHHVSEQSGFQLNSGAEWNIEYNADVLDEFIGSGLISPPGGNTGGLVINDVKLRPELVSISY